MGKFPKVFLDQCFENSKKSSEIVREKISMISSKSMKYCQCRGNYVNFSVNYLYGEVLYAGTSCAKRFHVQTTDALKKHLRRFGGQDRKLVMHLSTL